MSQPDPSTATRLLKQARSGDRDCLGELIPLVYGDLRRLAAGALRRERPNHTLQPTALVHDAYLRLVNQTGIEWKDRAHFLAVAAREMRRVLVDHARGHRAKKRGGDWHKVTLQDGDARAAALTVDALDLDEALTELAKLKARHGQVVELRHFGGMTHKEIAHVLDVSPETVKKDWQFARAWLRRRLGGSTHDDV